MFLHIWGKLSQYLLREGRYYRENIPGPGAKETVLHNVLELVLNQVPKLEQTLSVSPKGTLHLKLSSFVCYALLES